MFSMCSVVDFLNRPANVAGVEAIAVLMILPELNQLRGMLRAPIG